VVQAGDEPYLHGIGDRGEGNEIVVVAAFDARTRLAQRCDHGHLVANKIGCHRRQSIVLTVGPPVLDLDSLPSS
jgi:hypothetical protein